MAKVKKNSQKLKAKQASSKHKLQQVKDEGKAFGGVSLKTITFWVPLWISFCFYLSTLSPSIAGGDSGELLAEGCQLGTSHPPGYPLYQIVVYLVSKLAFLTNENVAMMVNLSSCVFGSLSSGYLSLSTFDILLSRDPQQPLQTVITAICTGLFHSFTKIAWQYHITAEVFALHNLFVSLILFRTTRFALEPTARNALIGAFISGLALTNQHTSILLVIPCVSWVLFTSRCFDGNMKLVGACAAMFLTSFTVLYLTLPLLSILFPHAGSWGDVTSIKGLIRHVMRADYGTFQLYSGGDGHACGFWYRTILWFQDFTFSQTNPFVVGCLFLGIYNTISNHIMKHCKSKQFQSDRKSKEIQKSQSKCYFKLNGPSFEMLVLASLLFYLVVFHGLSNLPLDNDLFFGIHQRFWMHANILSFFFVGIGLLKVLKYLTTLWPQKSSLVIFLPLVFVIALGAFTHSSQNQRDNYHFSQYAKSILSSLPLDSVLLTNYDQQWTSVRYLQECEGYRTDVTSLHLGMMSYSWFETKRKLYPSLIFPGKRYGQGQEHTFQLSDFLKENLRDKQRIFIGGKPSFPDNDYDSFFEEIPHGIVDEIVLKESGDRSAEEYRLQSKSIWTQVVQEYQRSALPDKKQYDQVTWESTIVREFFDHYSSRATTLLDLAVREGNASPNASIGQALIESIAWLELARLNDNLIASLPHTWKNLGLGYLWVVKNREDNLSLDIDDILPENLLSLMDSRLDDVWWNGEGEDVKSWASSRWAISWEKFLSMKESKNDPSFEQVKSMYESVLGMIKRH